MSNRILIKTRIENKFTVITFISVFMLGLISWLMDSGIIPILWQYDSDVTCTYKEYVFLMWDQTLCWEVFIDSMMRYISITFPIIVSFSISGFIEELNVYHVLGAFRKGDRKKGVIKAFVMQTVIGGMVVVIPLIMLSVAVDYFMYPAVDNWPGIGSILPDGFYYEHPLLVIIMIFILIYLPMMCAYAAMALSIAIFTRDKVKMILIPEAIYLFMNYVSIYTGGFSMTSAIDVMECYNTESSFGDLMIELIIQIMLAAVCIFIAFKVDREKKIVQ